MTCPAIASLLFATAVALTLSQPAGATVPDETAEAETRLRGDAYAHLMKAMFAARRGEFRAAGIEIRKAVKLQPETPAVYLEGAELFRSMGRQDEASQLARQALEAVPDHPPAVRFLADQAADQAMVANADAQQIRESLALYDQLAALEPLGEQALRKQANLQMLVGDLDGAIASAEALSEARPGDPDVVRMRYRLLVHAHREAEALQVLLHFIAGHPDDESMIEDADRLANTLDAWPLVAEVLDSNPTTRSGANRAQGLKGQALLRLGRLPEAAESLERALEVDSSDARTRLRLVFAYRMLGRLADAAVLAQALVDEAPGDSMRQLMLAQILDQQRDVAGALEAYGAALVVLATTDGENGWQERDSIRRRIAELRLAQGQVATAERMRDELERPLESESLRLDAEIALEVGDEAASRNAARLLREAGNPGDAARIEALLQVKAEHFAKADVKFREAIDALGHWVRFGAALAYRDAGQSARGETWLQEWVAAEPQDPAAWFDLGRYLFLDDRFAEAEPALVRTFELDPRHAAALNFLGYSLAERSERLDRALELVLRALEVDPWDGAYLDSLGWVYYRLGRFDDAREPLERAAREYPHDAVILDHLGDVYVGLGEPDLAVAAWTRALAVGVEDPDPIRAKLGRIPPAGPGGQAAAEGQAVPRPADRPMRP